MKATIQHSIEAAAVTILGACVAYWFAPTTYTWKYGSAEVAILWFLLAGATGGAFIYLFARVLTMPPVKR